MNYKMKLKKSDKLKTISEKLVTVDAEYDEAENKLITCKKELRIKMLEYNEIQKNIKPLQNKYSKFCIIKKEGQ